MHAACSNIIRYDSVLDVVIKNRNDVLCAFIYLVNSSFLIYSLKSHRRTPVYKNALAQIRADRECPSRMLEGQWMVWTTGKPTPLLSWSALSILPLLLSLLFQLSPLITSLHLSTLTSSAIEKFGCLGGICCYNLHLY